MKRVSFRSFMPLPALLLVALVAGTSGCSGQKKVVRSQWSTIDSLLTVTQSLHAERNALERNLQLTRDTLRTFDGISPEQYRRDQQTLRDQESEIRRLRQDLLRTRRELEAYEYFDSGPYERDMQLLKEQIFKLEHELASIRAGISPVSGASTPAEGRSGPQAAEPVVSIEEEVENIFSLRGEEEIVPALGGYTWVVGLKESRREADAMARRLRNDGFRAGVLRQLYRGRDAFRVVIGQFESEDDALAARSDLPDDVPNDAWLLRLRD